MSGISRETSEEVNQLNVLKVSVQTLLVALLLPLAPVAASSAPQGAGGSGVETDLSFWPNDFGVCATVNWPVGASPYFTVVFSVHGHMTTFATFVGASGTVPINDAISQTVSASESTPWGWCLSAVGTGWTTAQIVAHLTAYASDQFGRPVVGHLADSLLECRQFSPAPPSCFIP